MRGISVAVMLLGLPLAAAAQDAWTYRARVQVESSSSRANPDSPIRPVEKWTSEPLFVLSGDGAWTPHERLRLVSSATALLTSSVTDGRLREGYLRTGTSWFDFEAGKRIVRWGVGYGFAPAGVLDPPRRQTDPTDRLQLNEGRTMLKGDIFVGESTITLAALRDVVAMRFARVLPGGTELGIIAAAGSEGAPRYAATTTHVIGRRLELHGELLSHSTDDGRTISASAGLQYTFPAGLNVVVEYHRNGRGLTDGQWREVRSGHRPVEGSISRRNAAFLRVARAGSDLALSPEVIVIANRDDGSWTLVPSMTWSPQHRLQIYARATRLVGGRTSLAGFAPTSTTLTVGGAVRF